MMMAEPEWWLSLIHILIGTGVNPRGIVIKEQMAVIAAKIPHKIIIAVPE